MRTVAPRPFELEEDPQEDLAPPQLVTSPVSDRYPQQPPPAAEPNWDAAPPSFEEEMNLAPPRPAASAREEYPRAISPQPAAGMRQPAPPPPIQSEPESYPAAPASPERARHWSALFEEDPHQKRIETGMDPRRAAPPERKPSPTPEPAPESTNSIRAAMPPTPERPRESAPLFASEPRRSTASPSHEMEPAQDWPHADSSIEVKSESSCDAEESAEEDDPVNSHDPMFPKLLKRIATVGRAALPIVPHVLPREGRIGATVSAVTAVSSALVAHATQQANAAQSAPKVDLAPIGDNIDVLRAAQKELRDKIADQSAIIERVQDQCDMLCEAANRVESEQRDLVSELKFFSKWALVFAVGVSVLLMASVAFEVVLILRQ